MWVALLLLLMASCSGEDNQPDKDGFWGFGDLTSDVAPPGGCNNTNCTGCCQSGGCMPGMNQQACGMGGNACQTCMAGQTCQSGFCSSVSNCKSTCLDGCCDDADICQPGNTNGACGASGLQCNSCGTDEVCSQGGICAPQGADKYEVVIVSLKIKDSWTICGLGLTYPEASCDPYVIAELGVHKGTSVTKVDQHQPTWNQVLFAASKDDFSSQQFKVTVMDEDAGPDQTIAECFPNIALADLQAGQKVLNCNADVTNVTFHFKPK